MKISLWPLKSSLLTSVNCYLMRDILSPVAPKVKRFPPSSAKGSLAAGRYLEAI